MVTEKHSLKATQERPTKCEDSVRITYLKATRLGDSSCYFQIKQVVSNLPPKRQQQNHMVTLPETNMFAPANGCFEDYPFLLGPGLFLGAFAISFREV